MKIAEWARRVGPATAAVLATGAGIFLGLTGEGPIRTSDVPAAATSPSTSASPSTVGSYADMVRQVLPSVVLIRTPDGLGSGVVLDRSGNIVTNAHVAGDATTFQVQVPGDPAPRDARLVGSSVPDDLAVIRVNDPSALVPARFGDSDKARAGDVVLAIGNPLGRSGSVTEGIISATGRAITERATQSSAEATLPGAIQTSAPINPGNSGGALVNASGQVIGIPTLAAVSPQSGAQAQGIGFAIPSNLSREISHQIIKSGHVTNSHRAALGAQVATVTGPDGGPAGTGIVSTTGQGPAEQPGPRVGDVIHSIGRTPTPDASALAQALTAAARPGGSSPVSFTREPEPSRPSSRFAAGSFELSGALWKGPGIW